MTAFDSKQINLNGTLITFAAFKESPANYIALFSQFMREKTLLQKESESREQYLKRIFSRALCHCAVRSANESSKQSEVDVCDKVTQAFMNTLGINVVKHSNKTSRIIFKGSGNEYDINNDNIEKLINAIKSESKYERTAVNVKFGVEFEFIGSNNYYSLMKFNSAMKDLVGINNYSEELRYRHNNGGSWMLGTDSSLSTRERGYTGYELTTPILSLDNEKDLETLKQVINLIYIHLDGHPNKSCGTHIHMSFDVPEATRELCKRFAYIYKSSEESLYDKLVPSYRRKNNNHYCRSVNVDDSGSRFCKLNLCNVAYRTKNLHLEFRQLNGTLDFDKVIAWAKLQRLYIEVTMSSLDKDLETFKDGLEFEKVICDECFNTSDIEAFLVMADEVA